MAGHDFWLRYLRLHSDPRTRAMHFIGTALAIVSLLAAAAMKSLWPFECSASIPKASAPSEPDAQAEELAVRAPANGRFACACCKLLPGAAFNKYG